MDNRFNADVTAIQSIGAVPTILEAVAAITGLRFVCVARVTQDSWTTCAVLDQLNFGLKPGDGLDISTTLCEEVRDTRKAIVIDKVSSDPVYCDHHTPRIYGFESYISVPIIRPNGEYFGTLCALDPLPADLSNTATIASMTMFAQLISLQLISESQLTIATEALLSERETAELREQFIAVLGHDLRNPLSAILNGTKLLSMMPEIGTRATGVVERIERSAQRISGLVDDVMDFTRGRMGGGIGLQLQHEKNMTPVFEHVVAELSQIYPERKIISNIESNLELFCDQGRIAQLLSNLLKNAIVHGDEHCPINVEASSENKIFTLSVSNSCEPLAQNTIDQLFKPFWRTTNQPADNQSSDEGLGLGLFIVSEIAQSHGGRIDVVSTEEVTSFIFTMSSAKLLDANC